MSSIPEERDLSHDYIKKNVFSLFQNILVICILNFIAEDKLYMLNNMIYIATLILYTTEHTNSM